MTKKEKITRNIGLSFDLIRKLIANPTLMEKYPSGTTFEFVEKDFAPHKKSNDSGAIKVKVTNHLEITD